jgi:hypothetical protein
MLSFTKDSNEDLKYISSLALELMVMVEFKASTNNQCPTNWFKLQTEIIGLKQSTIV